MKYREFVAILEQNGFVEVRQTATHHMLEGRVNGVRQLVTADYSKLGEDIMKKNFHSMIRQSGLSKNLFRK